MTNKKILTLISLLLFLFLLVGCWPKQNLPPEITSDPVKTATVGVDYIYNVVATDPNPGDVLTYSLTTEPSGMLINGTSGVITWKADDITAAGIGDYDVVVVVSDEGGLSDSQDFTIKVSEFVVELVKIEIDPETMILYKGGVLSESETIKSVTAYYNDGTETPLDFDDYTYGLNPMGIVTVTEEDLTGLFTVTAEAVGETAIAITYKGKTDTIEVTVKRILIDIEVKPDDLILTVGEHGAIESVTAYYKGNLSAELDLDACDYLSSNTNYVTVSSAGVVTAVEVTTDPITITVSYTEEGITATFPISITVEPATG